MHRGKRKLMIAPLNAVYEYIHTVYTYCIYTGNALGEGS